MNALRRSSARSRRLLPHRQSWHNLSAYTSTPTDVAAWKNLRSRDLAVDSLVEKHRGGKKAAREEVKEASVDWQHWEKNIGHKEIVKCMKSFYEQQMSLIKSASSADHKEFVNSQKDGWELFDLAVVGCEKAVEASENLVANGARGLWVSYHNPPITKVDDNEWLDSDRHWQAVVEKQYLYNPTASIAEESLPKWKEVLRDGWRFKMEAFNARSDTPVLYQYMDQLPSWEYYDIHRRAFLEHMTYYLIRTAGDYRMFPECPPWKWLAHIEELRHQFIAVAQRRRAAFQLFGEHRELPLDLQPLDADHHGEEHFSKLLNDEVNTFEQSAARLMGNYCFLSFPYVPVQTESALYRLMAKYESQGGGKLYNIGKDVNALFFLPNINKTVDTAVVPTAREALNSFMDHLTLSGKRLNPGYATMLDIHTQILELRGQHWLTAAGESVCDAFMRRLHPEDPSYNIYRLYVQELKERFSSAVEIPEGQQLTAVREVESAYAKECELYEMLHYGMDTAGIDESSKEVQRLHRLSHSDDLSPLLKEGAMTAVTKDKEGRAVRVTDVELILRDLQDFSERKQQLMEAMKAEKLSPDLFFTEAPKLKASTGGSESDGREDMRHLEGYLRSFTDK